MKRTLLAALALSMFAGCAGMPRTVAETDANPTQMTSFVARAGSVLERLFRHEPAQALQAADAQTAAAAAASAEEELRREQSKALSGDRDAMFRIAMMYRDGSNGLQRDERKMISWLRQASDRDHKLASYQLYQHYLERGLDRQAVHFEKVALRQGYVLPVRLDPRRG